ncbi:colicin import membrane protein [Massilia sp. UYP11]|uniref:hypothetical protein n=1 Tax=Massilia sp. UYP11 TaxID=1756385 RepID=UPI003D20B4B2
MRRQPMLRAAAVAALTLLLAACAGPELALQEAPPAPTTSPEQAEQRLATVASERAAIEARFAEREVVCYEKFFVNRCLDEAREVRRAALATQRAIEIEASHYLRRLKVEERDRAIAEADAAYAQEEARLAAEPPPVKKPAAAAPPAKKPAAAAPPRARSGDSRVVRGQQRAQESTANAEQEAAERAANVAAYEERRRKSQERQKEVARRVAEREAKAAERAADEARRANGNQPAPTN